MPRQAAPSRFASFRNLSRPRAGRDPKCSRDLRGWARQAAIVHDFRARFAAGSRVLCLGDTNHTTKYLDEPGLREAGVPVAKHDKLPDVVLYGPENRWLYLTEAVTSHGPVSSKRHLELEAVLAGSRAGRVYVSAFPSFKEFKKYAEEIARETEVWVADFPEHLLHYNGDRFFGPR